MRDAAGEPAAIRDLAIRMALGASRGDVVRHVLVGGSAALIAGAAVGLLFAAALSRSLSAVLFEVDPLDPLALVSSATTLVAAGVVARYVPARRAGNANPALVLETFHRERERLTKEFEHAVSRQEAVANAVRWCSPTNLLYQILTALAGTDRARREDVVAQGQRYEAEYKRFLQPRMVANLPMSSTELGETPRFHYREAPGSAAVQRSVASLTGLVLWAATMATAIVVVSGRTR